MAIGFTTWVSVLPSKRTTSCHFVDLAWDLDLQRTEHGLLGWETRHAVWETWQQKPRSANFRSTSVPRVCSWAWVRVDLRRRGVESGYNLKSTQLELCLHSVLPASKVYLSLAASRIKEMRTSRVSSCNEKIRYVSPFARGLHEAVRLQTPSHLTPSTCSGSMRSEVTLFECNQRACPAYRPEVWNHEAFTDTTVLVRQIGKMASLAPMTSNERTWGKIYGNSHGGAKYKWRLRAQALQASRWENFSSLGIWPRTRTLLSLNQLFWQSIDKKKEAVHASVDWR